MASNGKLWQALYKWQACMYKWQAPEKWPRVGVQMASCPETLRRVGVQMASTWKMAAIGYTNGNVSETLLRFYSSV
jgi:hypothetical protein